MTSPGIQPRLLVVDDDDTFRKVLARELARRGYSVSTAVDGKSAIKTIKEGDFDVTLLDLKLPDLDGIEVLKQTHEENLRGEIVMLTGHGTIDSAIQAIRLGAYDFVTKPCSVDELEVKINKALERNSLRERNAILSDGLVPSGIDEQFVGRSKEFRDIMTMIDKVAPTDAAVLITGETGVGKGMVANLIHTRSARNHSPFVVVDCGVFHKDLLQSELFGHEKGAFTGAIRRRHGLFEVAHTGTIFLDEIADIGPATQANLLRVIETGLFRRLGANKENRVSVRVITASNKNLPRLIAEGHFRDDLYFRLSTIRIDIPPLRERRDDIRVLLDYFCSRQNQRYGHDRRFSKPALEILLNYSWPGNVRELINIVEQSFVLSETNVIEPTDLPLSLSAPAIVPPAESLPRGTPFSLKEVQVQYINAVLNHVGGHRARAAQILQISVRNLYRIMKSLGFDSGTEPNRPADASRDAPQSSDPGN